MVSKYGSGISLLEKIIMALTRSPGLHAREIAHEIRHSPDPKIRDQTVRRKHVNSILYKERDVFWSKRYYVPQWYLIKSSDTPEPKESLEIDQIIIDWLLDESQTLDKPPKFPPSVSTSVSVSPPLRRHRRIPLPKIPEPIIRKKLYKWQKKAVTKWKDAEGQGIIEAVTGTGKTLYALHIVSKYVAAGKRTLIIVPSIVLLEQWKTAIQSETGMDVTSLLGGRYGRKLDLKCPITIGVVNTTSKMAPELEGHFHLVVADECHRYAAEKYRNALLKTAPHRLGLTAILERSDEGVDEVLHPYFGEKLKKENSICFRYGYDEAKKDDVVAQYSVATIGVDLVEDEREQYEEAVRKLNKARNDLINQYGYSESFGKFMDEIAKKTKTRDEGIKAGIFTKAMNEKKEILSGSSAKLELIPDLAGAIRFATRTLVFCETIAAAKKICSTLVSEGIKAKAYHSDLTDSEKEEILGDLASGKIECVVAVQSLDEGVDVPDIDLGIIVAGTKQKRQMIQRLGRVIRKKEDGRNAFFITVYANETSEDPTMGEFDDGYVSIIKKHAEDFYQPNIDNFDEEEFGRLILSMIHGIELP